MNHLKNPNSIIKLIGKNSTNPFIYWPNTTEEEISGYLQNSLKEDNNIGKIFFFEKHEEIQLYFQIVDLQWDSEHFGIKCAAIKHFYINEELDFIDIDGINKSIQREYEEYIKFAKIRFISADVSSHSKNGNYFIQRLGFRFILNWIDGIWVPTKFEKDDLDIPVSNLLPSEVELFSKIATDSYYKEGRFYLDKGFDSDKVDKVYGELIKNSFLSGDIMLSIRDGDKPVGIFVCKQIKSYKDFNNLKVAHLRFLLIHPNYRGKSFGNKIFAATLQYLRKKCDLIVSGLESHNIISMNLHSKMGFKFTYSHNAFHFWNLK